MPVDYDYLLYEASVRTDRPALQASQVEQAAVCPGSAAASSVADDAHAAYTMRSGFIWSGEVREPSTAERRAQEPGDLVDARLSLMVDGSVHAFGAEPSGPVLQARVPRMWATENRLVRDGAGWRCDPGSTLHVAGDVSGERPAFPRDFSELLCAGVLAAKWVSASGDVAVTACGSAESQTVLVSRSQAEILRLRLRRIVAKVEQERQKQANGQKLEFVPGFQCVRCLLRLRCDLWVGTARAASLSFPSGKVDPASLVLAIDWMSESSASARGMLRDIVNASGPILLPDGTTWARRTTLQRTWAASAIVRAVDLEVGSNLSSVIARVDESLARQWLDDAVATGSMNAEQRDRVLAKLEGGQSMDVETHSYGRTEEPCKD